MTTMVRKLQLRRRFHPNEAFTVCHVEMEIDLERIIRVFGQKAFSNKSKRAVALGGDVTIRVRECEEQSK